MAVTSVRRKAPAPKQSRSRPIPLRDVTVTWAPGAPGERRFSGADLARVLAYAMTFGDNLWAVFSNDQDAAVTGLAETLATLGTGGELDALAFVFLAGAARDIAAKLHCPGLDAARLLDNFAVTLGTPKAVTS